jgi:hypothetical protein
VRFIPSGPENIGVFARSSSIRTEGFTDITVNANTAAGFNAGVLLVDGSSLVMLDGTSIDVPDGFEARGILAINGSTVRTDGAAVVNVLDGSDLPPPDSQALRLETGSSALIQGGAFLRGSVAAIGSSIRLTEASLVSGTLAAVDGGSAVIDGEFGECQDVNASCSVQIIAPPPDPGLPPGLALFADGASAIEAVGVNAIGFTTIRDASAALIQGSFGVVLVAGPFSTIELGGANHGQIVCLTEQGRSQVTASGATTLRNDPAVTRPRRHRRGRGHHLRQRRRQRRRRGVLIVAHVCERHRCPSGGSGRARPLSHMVDAFERETG